MIPRDYITEWRVEAPWVQDSQVEQDLVISRALVEIFWHPRRGLFCPCKKTLNAVVTRILDIVKGCAPD